MIKNQEAAPEYEKSATAVWWDISRCPIPDDYDAFRVGPRIDRVLMSLGYSGPLSITAIGDLQDIPHEVLGALSSTGIRLREVACGSSSILLDMLHWNKINQPPGTIMLISDDLGVEALAGPLSRLHEEGYNILIAYPHTLPRQYVGDPEQPFGIVTSSEWLWDNFLKDSMDPENNQETRILECSGDLFVCKACSCLFASQSFEEFTNHLECREHKMTRQVPKLMKRYKNMKKQQQRPYGVEHSLRQCATSSSKSSKAPTKKEKTTTLTLVKKSSPKKINLRKSRMIE